MNPVGAGAASRAAERPAAAGTTGDSAQAARTRNGARNDAVRIRVIGKYGMGVFHLADFGGLPSYGAARHLARAPNHAAGMRPPAPIRPTRLPSPDVWPAAPR